MNSAVKSWLSGELLPLLLSPGGLYVAMSGPEVGRPEVNWDCGLGGNRNPPREQL